jgi:hypothetical protein
MADNLFRTAITCRWGKFIGDALLNSIDAVNFTPSLSPVANMALVVGTNNQISTSNQQVFPTVNPIDAINWADSSGRVGLCTVSAIREEGTPIIDQKTVSVNAVNSFSVTYTVPAGKKWTLKSICMAGSGGTGITQGSCSVAIYNPAGVYIPMVYDTTTTWTNQTHFNATTTLVLQEGWYIIAGVAATAETTAGTFTVQLLYQESLM